MTMTLHASPFTCSVAVHLVLAERGAPFELAWLHRGAERLIHDDAFLAVNPKRKVPALVLPDGEVLTEIVGVLLYLDEQMSDRSSSQRRRLVEWLSFLSTELHKQVLAAVFDPDTPKEAQDDAMSRLLPKVLDHVEQALAESGHLLGEPSVADDYLFWALLLLRYRNPELLRRPGLGAFFKAMLARPHVARVLALEQSVREAYPRKVS